MGVYINPPGMTKEAWLKENAEDKGNIVPAWPSDETILPICLMNNGPFTAASVCYSEDEMQAFNRPDDLRPKTWFYVEAVKLVDVSGEFRSYAKASPRIAAAIKLADAK